MSLAGMLVGLVGALLRSGAVALLVVFGGPMGLGSPLMMLGGLVVLGLGRDLSSLAYDALRAHTECVQSALYFITR